MAKGKKKKKDVDFQKVKLKVGRRLKRDIKETKAEFSTRKIILREVKSYGQNPLASLAHHSDHISHQGKLSLLNHFSSVLNPDIVKNLNKPILDSLSKFIVDQSEQVRAATRKCLKTCLNHMKQQHLPTRDFLNSLKPYLDCAYTHVARDIVSDCHKFIDYLVNTNDAQLFEPLMSIVLRRHSAGNLTNSDRNLAVKLKRSYLRHTRKQLADKIIESDRMKPLIWTETRYLLDLDLSIRNNNSADYEFQLGFVQTEDNIVEKFLEIVKDAGE